MVASKHIPWVIYIFAIFLFGLPTIMAGIRLVSGKTAFASSEHLYSAMTYAPIAVILAVSVFVMANRPKNGTAVAAWTILVGTLVFVIRMLPRCLESLQQGDSTLIDLIGIFFYAGIALVMNIAAWRTKRRQAQFP